MHRFLFLFLFSSLLVFSSMDASRKSKRSPWTYEAEVNVPRPHFIVDILSPSVVWLTPCDNVYLPVEIFTERERRDVRIRDNYLFGDKRHVIIDFSTISDDEYSYPLPGAKVISGFRAPRRRNHSGVDIKTFPKDTIRAAFSGLVRLSKPYADYGNVVVIRHPNGLETVYSHNHTNFVKPNEWVNAGDPIGLTGRTGRATTEHLHFEVRVEGVVIDPNLIFDMNNNTLHRRKLQLTRSGATISAMPMGTPKSKSPTVAANH